MCGEHYELFSGHKMNNVLSLQLTDQSGEKKKKSFGVDTQQPPLPTANVTRLLQEKEDFSLLLSLRLLSELFPKAMIKCSL